MAYLWKRKVPIEDRKNTLVGKISARRLSKTRRRFSSNEAAKRRRNTLEAVWSDQVRLPASRFSILGAGLVESLSRWRNAIPTHSSTGRMLTAKPSSTRPRSRQTMVSVVTNIYESALSYENATFDAIYAISVCSYFPENLIKLWLTEIARV